MGRNQIIHFMEPESRIRAELARVTFALGHHAEVYADTGELLDRPPRDGILAMRDSPARGGMAPVFAVLAEHGIWLPIVAMGKAPRAGAIVAAIKAGALDYLPLPASPARLARMLAAIGEEARAHAEARRRMIEARTRIAVLSRREREVLDRLAEGGSNKAIARELEISPRTVEIHRANMMAKLGAKHAAEALRVRFEARADPQR